MTTPAPTDAQKVVLHIIREALKRGADDAWISRDDMLNGKTVPVHAGMKLVWAALSMPDGVLEWSADQQKFRASAQLRAALT